MSHQCSSYWSSTLLTSVTIVRISVSKWNLEQVVWLPIVQVTLSEMFTDSEAFSLNLIWFSAHHHDLGVAFTKTIDIRLQQMIVLIMWTIKTILICIRPQPPNSWMTSSGFLFTWGDASIWITCAAYFLYHIYGFPLKLQKLKWS